MTSWVVLGGWVRKSEHRLWARIVAIRAESVKSTLEERNLA